MNRKLFIVVALSLFAFAGSSTAHPLGNFSINQYTRIDVGKSEIRLRQVFDMAEIPTFQESSLIDADKNGTFSDSELRSYIDKITPGYIQNLRLTVMGEPLTLAVTRNRIWTDEGAGNLPTLKMTWDIVGKFSAAGGVSVVHFENHNYADRVGWSEIVAGSEPGINVFNSSVYGSGLTDELKAYPQERLNSPLSEKRADFSFTATTVPDGAAPLKDRDGHVAGTVQKDKLAELIAVPEITPAIALIGLVFAFGLGMLHAMSPGHGKTVVGAYLVGSKGTIKHAAFLGMTVTVTHTLGVFALGLLTLFASNFILPETIMPFLSFFSGLIVLYIGLSMFKSRLFAALGTRGHHHHHGAEPHSHDDQHSHDHDGFTHTHDGKTHSHLPPDEISWKSLLALGVSGGLLPCPSALVLMLSAINLNRVGYGLILTTAFSFGLAATLTAVGLIFVYGGYLFKGSRLRESRILKALPVMSAFVIACLGAVICYQSLA